MSVSFPTARETTLMLTLKRFFPSGKSTERSKINLKENVQIFIHLLFLELEGGSNGTYVWEEQEEGGTGE